MRPAHTLSSYVAREVALYTALGLAAITLVLVGRNLLRQLGGLVAAGASAADVLGVLGNLTSMLAAYALPIAFLFGVLLATSRLASDRETLAMDSCGVGLRALLAPVAVMGLLVSCLTAYLVGEVEHRARRELRLQVRTLAAEGRLIEAGGFREVGDRVIFVKRRRDDDQLEGVVIADRGDPARPRDLRRARRDRLGRRRPGAAAATARRGHPRRRGGYQPARARRRRTLSPHRLRPLRLPHRSGGAARLRDRKLPAPRDGPRAAAGGDRPGRSG